MHRTPLAARSITALAAATLLVPVALAQNTAPTIAPPQTMWLFHVPSFASLMERFDGSTLDRMYRDPAIRTLLEDTIKSSEDGIDAMLEALGYDRDDLVPPTGEAGVALWTVMPEPEDEDDAGDDEFAFNYTPPENHFIAYVDFGDNAASWREITTAWIEHLSEMDGEYRVEEDQLDGHTISSIIPLAWEEDQNAEDDNEGGDEDWNEEEDWDMEDEGDGQPDPTDLLQPEQPLYVTWVGDAFLGSTSLDRLERAIESLGGKDIDSLADSDAFSRATAMLPAGGDIHAVIMLDQVWKPFLQGAGFMLSMVMGDADPESMLDTLGLSGVKAVAMGVSVRPERSALSIDMAVLAPQRRGILSLIDFPASPVEPPAWVGESVANYSAFRVRFDRIIPFAREVIASFPEDQRQQAEFGFNQFAALAGPVLDTLGPEVFATERINRPLAADSKQALYVIPARDEIVVQNVMQLASQSMGLEARQFEGATLYSGEFFPLALAIGYGRAFIGTETAVEDALRAAANPGAAPLAQSDRWRAASAFVSREASMAGVSNTIDAIEAYAWNAKNQRKIMEEQLANFGDIDQETRDAILASYETPAWVEEFPDAAVWKRYLGEAAWDLRSASDGMRSTLNILKPSDE